MALLRELENQRERGNISFMRMVELLNQHAAKNDAPVDPIPWPEQAAWENAPEGTFARAVDGSGDCYFYAMTFFKLSLGWTTGAISCGKIPDMTGVDWKQTLQFKPK